MPFKSRWPLDPPNSSIPSFIFGSSSSPLDNTNRIILDAKRPETHYFTLHTYREWSKRIAGGLQAAGLRQGDRVMLFSGNNIFTPVVIMGSIMAGAIYNSINPAYTPREVAHQLKDAEPRFVIAAENCLERAQQAADLVGFSRDRIYLFSEVPMPVDSPVAKEEGHWSQLIADPEVGRRFEWEELNTPELCRRTCILVYSSGTTGLSKGVETTHRNVISNVMQMMIAQNSDKSITLRRTVCAVPMFHGLGLVYYTFVAPRAGIQTYLMERWDLQDMLDHIQRFSITELILVPPMLVAMAKHPSCRSGQRDLSSIRKVVAGAAPIGREVTEQFEQLWSGKLKVRQAWGMSEALCISLCWDEMDDDPATSTSVGELVPGGEAMVTNDDGKEVTKVGERGEFWYRSPNAMKGYWRNEKATQETITKEGWMKTGDVAYRDEKGKWYMVDRKKELIKVRGAQVAPAELEALLLEHPEIVDAAVIGVKSGVAGDEEWPRAYVVLRQPAKVTKDEVVEFVNSRVSKAKKLMGGVRFIDAVPKNPSGKILRRQLREQAEQETKSRL